MPKDREYETLLSQYNILVAKYRDLSEQMRVKTDQMVKYETEHDIIEKHARELCEMILAKNRSEMVLGNNRTWHSFSTDELIAKAKQGFVAYNQEKTEVLNQVMAISERRGQELDSLKDQIARTINSGGFGGLSADQMLQQAKEESQRKAAIEKTPAATQAAIKSGAVTCIVEEDEDIDADETEAIQEMMNIGTEAKLSTAKAAVKRSEEKVNKMKEAQRKSVLLHTVDLNQITGEWTEIQWFIFEQMGRTGISRVKDITDLCIARFGANQKTAIQRGLYKMKDQKVVDYKAISLPHSKKLTLYYLLDAGKLIFQAKYNADPAPSELEKVVKEHDNPEHGFGIMDLKTVLEEKGKYESISAYTRNKPFDVVVGERNYQYIPDLICKTKKFTDYYEYEIGKTAQTDFNLKCSKMCQVTKYLNFVTPNQASAKRVKAQVDAWIESRGVKSLKGITVRISTVEVIAQQDKWLVQYSLSTGAEPTENAFGS